MGDSTGMPFEPPADSAGDNGSAHVPPPVADGQAPGHSDSGHVLTMRQRKVLQVIRESSFCWSWAGGTRRVMPLVLLRSRSIPVTGDSRPGARSGSANTTWMPHPRRWNDMRAASTPYDLLRAVPV